MNPDEMATEAPKMQAKSEFGASVLWTYIDVRDAATCVRLSLEHDQPGHSAFYANAPTTFMPQPTLDLLKTHYPNVTVKAEKLSGTTAPIDCSAAREKLGFQPEFLWTGA
jgi:nucleoside-diphosphate-sugar epimerase